MPEGLVNRRVQKHAGGEELVRREEEVVAGNGTAAHQLSIEKAVCGV